MPHIIRESAILLHQQPKILDIVALVLIQGRQLVDHVDSQSDEIVELLGISNKVFGLNTHNDFLLLGGNDTIFFYTLSQKLF